MLQKVCWEHRFAVLIIDVTSDRIVLIQYQDQESKCVTIDQSEKAGIRICCPYAYNDDMHHNWPCFTLDLSILFKFQSLSDK